MEKKINIVKQDGGLIIQEIGIPIKEKVSKASFRLRFDRLSNSVGIYSFNNLLSLTQISNVTIQDGASGIPAQLTPENFDTLTDGLTESEGGGAGSAIPLISTPQLWTPGKTYDFGDGLYGRRSTGTITANANVLHGQTLLADNNFGEIMTYFYESGGWWEVGISGLLYPVNSNFDNVRFALLIKENKAFDLYTKSDTNRTNARYDVWFIYTHN